MLEFMHTYRADGTLTRAGAAILALFVLRSNEHAMELAEGIRHENLEDSGHLDLELMQADLARKEHIAKRRLTYALSGKWEKLS